MVHIFGEGNGQQQAPDEIGGIYTSDEAAMKKAGIVGGITKTDSGILLAGGQEQEQGVPRMPASRVQWQNEDEVRYMCLGHVYNPEALAMFEKKAASYDVDAIIAFGLGKTKSHIEKSIEILLETGIRSYIMPGKYEKVDDWKEAVEKIKDRVGEETFNKQISDMTAYNSRVSSGNHYLLFLPGSFDQQAGGNYIVVDDQEFKTQTINHKARGKIRVVNLDDHFNFISPEQGPRTIAITHELPKYDNSVGVDRARAARVYDPEKDEYTVIPFREEHRSQLEEHYGKNIEFDEAFYMKPKDKKEGIVIIGEAPEMEEVVVPLREVDDLEDGIRVEKRPIYANLGNEGLEKAMRLYSIGHLVSAGNSSRTGRSCNRRGDEAVTKDWSQERHLNMGKAMGAGNYAILHVREIGEDRDGRSTGIESRVTTHHVLM
jgi:hypothetical protein